MERGVNSSNIMENPFVVVCLHKNKVFFHYFMWGTGSRVKSAFHTQPNSSHYILHYPSMFHSHVAPDKISPTTKSKKKILCVLIHERRGFASR